jgi:hypothetical protein
VQRSTITVHVGKAGVFSVAGHEHWVNAPIAAGVLNLRRLRFLLNAASCSPMPACAGLFSRKANLIVHRCIFGEGQGLAC